MIMQNNNFMHAENKKNPIPPNVINIETNLRDNNFTHIPTRIHIPSNQRLLNDYIKYLNMQNFSILTISSCKTSVNQLLKWIKNKSFLSVTRNDIKDYIIFNKERGKWKKPGTFAAYIKWLRHFYKFLIAEELITQEGNPLKNIFAPKGVSKGSKVMPLTRKEIKKAVYVIGAPCTTLMQKTMFYIFLSSGMRARELMKIKKHNIDFKERQIFLEKEDTKGKVDSRIVPISPIASKLIKEYMIIEANVTEYLFVNEEDRPIGYHKILQAINDILARAFPYPHLYRKGYGPHTLRHTFFSLLAEANCDLNAMRVIGGWTNFDQVNRYVHTSKQFLSAEIRKIGRKLWKI